MNPLFKKIFFLVLIGLSFPSSGQEKSAVSPHKNSLLWKIEGNGLEKGTYLFGTMHLIEKEYFVFPDKLKKLVSKTDLLVLEIAGMPSQSEALKMLILEQGSFFDYFDDPQKDSIFVWARQEMKMDSATFRATLSQMKPFVLIQLATQMQFMGKTESYEKTFEKIAKDNKIQIHGLETVQQQMALFDNLSRSEQAEMVMEVIRDSKKSLEFITQLQQVYQQQNLDSLFTLLQSEKGILAQKQADFLDNRNRLWVPQIKNLVSYKKCFIAVGAGHLSGENGLIQLLKKEGFILSPVEI
jgi:uncharacterized protein